MRGVEQHCTSSTTLAVCVVCVVTVPKDDQQSSPPPPSAFSKYRETCKHLVSGACAGAVSRTCVSPLERLKILLQLQPSRPDTAKYGGIIPSLKLIHREEGFRGFYKVQ